MSGRNRWVYWILVGALLVPGPAYVLAYDAVAPDRSSTGYRALRVTEESSITAGSTVSYRNLSSDEQRAFDNIREATAVEEQYSYVPRAEESIPTATIVKKNGIHYRITAVTNAQDIPIAGFFMGLAASVTGLSMIAYILWRRLRNLN